MNSRASAVTTLVLLIFLCVGRSHAQWVQTLGTLPDVPTCFHSAGGRLYVGVAAKGVYASTDNGDSWFVQNEGLKDSDVVSLYSFQGMLFAGTLGGGVFRTTIPPTGWQEVNTGLIYKNIMCFGGLGVYLYAGGYSEGVYRSNTLGAQWDYKGLGNRVFAIEVTPTRLFVATRDKVATSTNWGDTWESRPEYPYMYFNSLAILNEEIYTGTNNDYVYRSTDGGASWEHLDDSLESQYVNCLAQYGDCVFAGVVGGAGVYMIRYHGNEWARRGEGFQYKEIRALGVHPPYLVAFERYTGIWRRLLSEISSGADQSRDVPPPEWRLEQNYPNPFNPTTTIQFTIVNRQLTIVKVYDLLGREVATLVNEVKEPGTYSVEFDARSLASGIYFYRIQAGSFVQTKKVLLLR